jgi:hypothetical protein
MARFHLAGYVCSRLLSTALSAVLVIFAGRKGGDASRTQPCDRVGRSHPRRAHGAQLDRQSRRAQRAARAHAAAPVDQNFNKLSRPGVNAGEDGGRARALLGDVPAPAREHARTQVHRHLRDDGEHRDAGAVARAGPAKWDEQGRAQFHRARAPLAPRRLQFVLAVMVSLTSPLTRATFRFPICPGLVDTQLSWYPTSPAGLRGHALVGGLLGLSPLHRQERPGFMKSYQKQGRTIEDAATPCC